MSIKFQTNENTCLINKDWTDDDTLEEIVKYEFQKTDKSEYIQENIKLLKKNCLKVLRDWKELCTHTTFLERSNKYNDVLVLLLNRVASIEPINVSSQKIQKKTGKSKEKVVEENIKTMDMEKTNNFSLFNSVFHWVSDYFWINDLECNNGNDQCLHSNLEHRNVNFGSNNTILYISCETMRKRK
jgi:hypothetical protein